MSRITKEDYFLQIANAVGLRSTCLRARCGAIIVQNGTIISTGYNGSTRCSENCSTVGICKRPDSSPEKDKHLCPAIHGEINSIINLARNGSGSTINSTMFVHFVRMDDKINTYNKPCTECMRVIINAGIKFIVLYTEDKEKTTLDVSEIENGIVTTEHVLTVNKNVEVTALVTT